MSSQVPPACSACDSPLGPKEEEIAHPDDDNPPGNPHFKVQIRSDDEERLQCTETGQLASVVLPDDPEHPANEGMGEGEGDGNNTPEDRGRRNEQEIYDLPEEKSPLDILKEVVTNESYGLEEPQIKEIKGWAKDYNGQIPPNVLEDILKNMQGVQKQTAQLMRQRYELKLNKYFQEQSTDESGPPIGVTGGMAAGQPGSGQQSNRTTPTPSTTGTPQEPKTRDEKDEEHGIQDRDVGGPIDNELRGRRRLRRTRRRQDVMDKTAEEVAKQAAPEIARELTSNFGTYFGIPAKILEAKAEKDPDWFLEKLDELGLDIDDFLESSEKKKQEMKSEERNQPETDQEVDDALSEILDDDDEEDEMDDEYIESTNTDELQQQHEDEQMPDDGEGDEEFGDVFGEEATVE